MSRYALAMTDDLVENGPNSKGYAFLCWLACVFGFCGIHRFYLGRPGTGILYLFTFGLFGVGQFIDLIRLPAMVAEENTKNAALRALAEKRALPLGEVEEDTPEVLRQKLLEAAAERGGKLTVAQGVLATGKTFQTVEQELDEMVKSGYVNLDNHPETGAIIYDFGEL